MGGYVRVDVEAFIQRWSGREGGAERANYAMFLGELCDVLGVARPDPADASARSYCDLRIDGSLAERE